MTKTDIIETLIYPAIDELSESVEKPVNFSKSPETPLFELGSMFDSLGLVNLVVLVEEQISKKTGKAIRLVNDKAMSRAHSPFKTVATLAEYIGELLEGGQ